MSSIPASSLTNSGISTSVSNLLQTLSAIDPGAVSNPAVAAALQKAPASDIVQLSTAAAQLQNVDALFGTSDTTGLPASSAFGSPSSDTPNQWPFPAPVSLAGLSASQLASYASSLQASDAASLFDWNNPTVSPTGADPLLNVTG
jgi:hypothetical protein